MVGRPGRVGRMRYIWGSGAGPCRGFGGSYDEGGTCGPVGSELADGAVERCGRVGGKGRSPHMQRVGGLGGWRHEWDGWV